MNLFIDCICSFLSNNVFLIFYIFLALISSILIGIYAFEAISEKTKNEIQSIPSKVFYYQIFFNASCSIFGWILLWYNSSKIFNHYYNYTISDVLIIIIIILGITGKLPLAIQKLAERGGVSQS